MSPRSNITSSTPVFVFLLSAQLSDLPLVLKKRECQYVGHLELLSLANVMLLYVLFFCLFHSLLDHCSSLEYEKWHFNFVWFLLLPQEDVGLYIMFQRLSTHDKWSELRSLLGWMLPLLKSQLNTMVV